MPDASTHSYWMGAPLPRFPVIDRNLTADVVVIGGGITGLTTAYLLHRAGLHVALLERARLATGDTGYTTAHLTCVTDLPMTALVDTFGESHAQAVWDAGLAAIAAIDEHVRAEGIDCSFAWIPGYLHVPVPEDGSARGRADLEREADVIARLGFDARFVERVPFVDRPGIEIDGQARFHPRRYLEGLVRALTRGGVAIFEESDVDEVTDDPLTVHARGCRITCDRVVAATHNPIVGKAGLLTATVHQTKLALYSSYVVAGRAPRGTVPDALFWDTGDPYRYVRLDRDGEGDIVIVGGEDHKTGQVDDTRACFERLETFARQLIPGLQPTHRWSGQVIETYDGLPFIGEIAPRQFIATGFSGNGMTFGTLAGLMAHDEIVGRRSPWRDLFTPGRTTVRGGLWDYMKENKDYPYYLIRDRFAGTQGRSLRAVPRGEGRVLTLNGEAVAAYRDPSGAVTMRSAVCTHMGCHVKWNVAERTWDCPCHGSRFTPAGDVISGPAESPLPPPRKAKTAARADAAFGREDEPSR